jgi:hypothetical protein
LERGDQRAQEDEYETGEGTTGACLGNDHIRVCRVDLAIIL